MLQNKIGLLSFSWQVGDGKSISVLQDSWINNIPINQSPMPFNSNPCNENQESFIFDQCGWLVELATFDAVVYKRYC